MKNIINFTLLKEGIILAPILFITGDIAHSKSFSETVYNNAKEPKELYIVQGNCMHIDLFDDYL